MTSLSQVAMPVVVAGGKLALAFLIIGFVAATFGAALETALSDCSAPAVLRDSD